MEEGFPRLLLYHEERMNRTRAEFFPGAVPLRLADYLPQGNPLPGVAKWRLVYDGTGVCESVCVPYQMREVRTLRLVRADRLDYAYKFEDRSALSACMALRGEADDVLVVRDGRITDTSIANVALWDGTHWCTPEHPLLCGVKRRSLLESRRIVERDIRVEELHRYTRIRLFNAMIEWGDIDFSIDNGQLIMDN